MPEEPQIKGLTQQRRSRFFWVLVLIFVCALPAVIFYTTGYRLSFENDETSIVTTGGIYIDTENTDVEVYIDEEQYDRPRLFQSAYYLQNTAIGQHRIVVQSAGLHTWVKELPVDPYIVTEVSAFNVPVTPRLRPITRYQNDAGVAVYFVATTGAEASIFKNATSTELALFSTSTDITQLELNPEYAFVQAIFASSTADVVSVFADNEPEARFQFAKPTLSGDAATTSTTTAPRFEQGDVRLVDLGWELYAQWQGSESDVPYYFCVSSSSIASTSERYGSHIAQQISLDLATTSTSSALFTLDDRTCRTSIKLDHLQQDVYYYDFFPGSADLVLLHLENGLYVTEIDDRAWQNTQELLPGQDFTVVMQNDIIYIKRDGYYFELITEIEEN